MEDNTEVTRNQPNIRQIDRNVLKNLVASELPGEPDKSEQSKTTNVELIRSRFGFIHVSDIIKTIGHTEWVIDGILETGALGCLFGDPASYKSFMALDWALCIASGTQWKGHIVKTGQSLC